MCLDATGIHSLESPPGPALPAPPLVFLNGGFSPFVHQEESLSLPKA
jgi:hypothetical protein